MKLRSSRAVLGKFGQVCMLLAATMLPTASPAQSPSPYDIINAEAAKSNIEVERLRGGLHVLRGPGGNIVVLAGPQSMLMARRLVTPRTEGASLRRLFSKGTSRDPA